MEEAYANDKLLTLSVVLVGGGAEDSGGGPMVTPVTTCKLGTLTGVYDVRRTLTSGSSGCPPFLETVVNFDVPVEGTCSNTKSVLDRQACTLTETTSCPETPTDSAFNAIAVVRQLDSTGDHLSAIGTLHVGGESCTYSFTYDKL